MKRLLSLLICLYLILTLAATVQADEALANPSVYNAGEISFHMPQYWLANYIEIQEYMKNFPDFQCDHYSTDAPGDKFDQIVCSSVNNRFSRDVIINFYFTGDHAGMTGLREAVFTIGATSPADIQDVLEKFWNPENYPWHTDSDSFYMSMSSLIFYSPNTVQRFDLPSFDQNGDRFITVDMWDSSQSRLAVG